MNAIQRFCDIVKTEMELEDDQVYLYQQKFDIPPDDRLYVAVGILSCKPFGNSRSTSGTVDALTELQSINMQATLNIDILSKSLDALNRKEEVLLALRSIYSEQQQEKYSFYVSALSTGFVNLSQLEGSAIPYRFNISVAIQYMITKNKTVDYYDNFTDTILTEA